MLKKTDCACSLGDENDDADAPAARKRPSKDLLEIGYIVAGLLRIACPALSLDLTAWGQRYPAPAAPQSKNAGPKLAEPKMVLHELDAEDVVQRVLARLRARWL